MKLISVLSRFAVLGVATFVLGLAFDTEALPLFSLTVGALVLLIVSADYAPRSFYRRRAVANIVHFPPAPVHAARHERFAA